jgi:hypothetical protein
MLLPRLKEGLTVLALVTCVGLLGAVAVHLAGGGGPPGSSQAARDQCLARYRRARSAADSAMVDSWAPVLSKVQAAFAKSCGLMRRAGELQPAGAPRSNSRAPSR